MAIQLKGRCVCNALQYSLHLSTADEARTTLCHCQSCRRAFGGNYGLTTKVPLECFKYDNGVGELKLYKQEDNGVTREFCGSCGAYICEYGEAAKEKFRYVLWGSLDEPERVPPQGEFFCKDRSGWMPEIPGVFHKQEITD
ncbi:Mss4-like protein [Mycena galopus ATCC 62051]|nr:Mss4-like protein [Mycena galopus ATCC 62051]